jgi:hypothetical protein
MLASRHLPADAFASSGAPPGPRTPVAARLANVLDRRIVRAMIGLDETLPALHALLILASWTGTLPAHTTNDPGGAVLQTQHLGIAYDGEFFIGVAVNLASRMHLEVDVEKALTHKQDRAAQGRIPPLSEETLERARMVSAWHQKVEPHSLQRTMPDVQSFQPKCLVCILHQVSVYNVLTSPAA